VPGLQGCQKGRGRGLTIKMPSKLPGIDQLPILVITVMSDLGQVKVDKFDQNKWIITLSSFQYTTKVNKLYTLMWINLITISEW
jgi:hypothetical protein